jgi:hypothetical protein
MIAIAVVMLCGVFSLNASAITPAPPYFYLDANFQELPPMGNETIADVEVDLDGNVIFLFKPEFFFDSVNEHSYVGTIEDMQVYDAYEAAYIDVLTGGAASVSSEYIQYNLASQRYFQFYLTIYVYDITAREDFAHIPIVAYFDFRTIM